MIRFPYLATQRPPIPAVRVTFRTPDGSTMIPNILAYLDTAASGCVVPLSLLHQLGTPPVSRAIVRGLGHAPTTLDVYDVGIENPGVAVLTVRAVGHPTEPTTLVGRDVLNMFRVTFDGPNQTTEFH
ncbi:MAG TPA: hypothetical protein VH092_21650 [Urbifossiella sp.]|nr:hypothetical protein [Urbifossiella sp.]